MSELRRHSLCVCMCVCVCVHVCVCAYVCVCTRHFLNDINLEKESLRQRWPFRGGVGGGDEKRTKCFTATQLWLQASHAVSEFHFFVACWQEIGHTHMRIAEGVQSLLQMSGLLARLCQKAASPDQLAQWRTQRTSSVSVSSFTWALKRTTVSLCLCELVYLCIAKDNDPQVLVSVCSSARGFQWVCLPPHWRKQPTSLGLFELVYLCTEFLFTHKALKTTTHKFGWGNVFERNITTHKFGFCGLVYLCIKNNNPQVWFLWTCLPVHWKKTMTHKFAYLWACLPVHWKKQWPTGSVSVSLFTCALKKPMTRRFSFCELVYQRIEKNNPQIRFQWVRLPVH